VLGPALRCRGFGSFYGILASSRSPRRAFAFTLAFVQLLIPFLVRHHSLLQPRLPPALLVSLRLSSKPLDLSRNLVDPSANPFASATCKPANFPALPESLLSAGRIPRLRTNTSPEPVAPLLATSMNRLTNIVLQNFVPALQCSFALPQNPPALSSPARFPSPPSALSPRPCLRFWSRACFCRNVAPPGAKSPALDRRSCSGNRTEGPLSYEDLLVLFNGCKLSQATFYDSALILPPKCRLPTLIQPRVAEKSLLVPGLGNLPFCTTTLIRPLKFRVLSSCSMAAGSAADALTCRRNSTKSLPLSLPLMATRSSRNQVSYNQSHRVAPNFRSQGRYT
jgi:hypothetical protein